VPRVKDAFWEQAAHLGAVLFGEEPGVETVSAMSPVFDRPTGAAAHPLRGHTSAQEETPAT